MISLNAYILFVISAWTHIGLPARRPPGKCKSAPGGFVTGIQSTRTLLRSYQGNKEATWLSGLFYPGNYHNRSLAHQLLLMFCFGIMLADANAAQKPGVQHGKPAAAIQKDRTETAHDALLSLGYLGQTRPQVVAPPFFQASVAGAGVQGALLGINDNNTTGSFTHQHFGLKQYVVAAEEDVTEAYRKLLAEGVKHILVDLPADKLVALSRLPEASETRFYNIGSDDDDLRGTHCAANILHLLPSQAMRADALAQFLLKKRWQKLLLVVGPLEADKHYAEALKRSAKKFGLKIVEEKQWQHSFDDRRTPESEVPVFTQGVEYDVILLADTGDQFGHYFPYRTWLPRPIAGTQGLVPRAWYYTHEQWGALQLQNRFRQQSGRWMTEIDYAAWLAVRAIGEAATRTQSVDYARLVDYLKGAEFSLAGFKGVPLSFRSWDGQLRQPVLLVDNDYPVSVAPLEGFLHPKNGLDTLGVDQAETQCKTGEGL
jgi:ABC transporter substrate binding protein (PQQ-dependent alcohol dehydrogenase system)